MALFTIVLWDVLLLSHLKLSYFLKKLSSLLAWTLDMCTRAHRKQDMGLRDWQTTVFCFNLHYTTYKPFQNWGCICCNLGDKSSNWTSCVTKKQKLLVAAGCWLSWDTWISQCTSSCHHGLQYEAPHHNPAAQHRRYLLQSTVTCPNCLWP